MQQSAANMSSTTDSNQTRSEEPKLEESSSSTTTDHVSQSRDRGTNPLSFEEAMKDIFDAEDEGINQSVESKAIEPPTPIEINDLRLDDFDQVAQRVIKESIEQSNKEADPRRPYDNKYAARDALTRLKSKLIELRKTITTTNNNTTNNEDTNNNTSSKLHRIDSLVGVCLYHIGTLFHETDEFSSAEGSLLRAISLLRSNRDTTNINAEAMDSSTEQASHSDNTNMEAKIFEETSTQPVDPEFVLELMDAFNYLGMIWSNRNDHRKAEQYLKRAETIFERWNEQKRQQQQQQQQGEQKKDDHEDSFRQKMEESHTMTVYYLAQVYGHLKFPLQSAKYCHLTLQRQLESKKDFDKLEWGTNCMQLSGYYLNQDDFAMAEHCLQAARLIIPPTQEKEGDAAQCNANISLAWGRYYLRLLRHSKSKMVEADLSDIAAAKQCKIEQQQQVPRVCFDKLAIPKPTAPKTPVTKFEDARELFKKALAGFNQALEYYVLDGFVTDHVGILQDISSLYKVLAHFESNNARKIAMHKRRAEQLEPLVNQLNPNVYLHILKQLTFELGEIYHEIVDIKMAQLEAKEKESGLTDKKINAMQAIFYFTSFLKYFIDNKSGKENIEEENIPAFVQAHFYCARLYSKVLTKDPAEIVATLKKSLDEYEFIKSFAKQHKGKIPPNMQSEVDMCAQMTELLPRKINEVHAMSLRSR